MTTGDTRVEFDRLTRIVLNAADAGALAAFFENALGFRRTHSPQSGAAGRTIALTLGESRLDLDAVGAGARPYPADVPGWSPLFQHIAIVTTDMRAAMARLARIAGWSPISTDGPQRLPESSGGVTAFKFRDPEGHPLELLAFPTGGLPEHWQSLPSSDPCLGIDHSAISVADTDRSVAFYASFGLSISGRSLNIGIAQQRLDAVTDPAVEVTALVLPHAATPHVELLRYRGAFDRSVPPAQPDDIAATRLVFAVAQAETLRTICDGHRNRLAAPLPAPLPTASSDAGILLRDPDGHLLQVECAEART